MREKTCKKKKLEQRIFSKI